MSPAGDRPDGRLKLFRIDDGAALELQGTALALEKPLQVLIERNMDVLFGVRFVASEYSTGKKHGGRIDSLGLDENGSPVIFEYKRSVNESNHSGLVTPVAGVVGVGLGVAA